MSAIAGIPAIVVTPAIVPATAEIVDSFSELHEKLSKWGIPFKKENKEYNCQFPISILYIFCLSEHQKSND